MTDGHDEFDDELRSLFRAATPEVEDGGFSARVVKHVRRRRRVRALVLGTAAAAGALLATGPTMELVDALSHGLVAVAGGWQEAELGIGIRTILVGVLALVVVPVLVGFLED